MSRFEQEALDEKIARIRRQNEEIIKRKQVIDEEIKSAERNNAIVNVKKSFRDDDDEPSLYSDSVSTQQRNTVIYPKLKVIENQKTDRQRNNQEYAAWRREREQIDNERIRRQKAASGWRREWDANKTFDDDESKKSQHNTADRSQVRHSNGNDNDDVWDSKRVNKSRGRNENDRDGKPEFGYRSETKKSPSEDVDWGLDGNTSSRSEKKINENGTVQPNIRNDLEMRKLPRKENNIKFTANANETENTSFQPTSGPLNQRMISVKRRDAPKIILNRVTKFSETKVQMPPETKSWKSGFSNMDDAPKVNLSERLKKIVISVKNDGDKEEAVRTVKVLNEFSTNTEKKEASNEGIRMFRTNFQGASGSKDAFEPEKGAPAFTVQQSNVFTFGDAEKSLGLAISDKPLKNDSVPSFMAKSSPPPAGILKSPTIFSGDQSKSDETKRKKSVVIQEDVNVDDDDDDDAWEDVSDNEWEEVSDEA